MKKTSSRYKLEMKEPFKNKWHCKIEIAGMTFTNEQLSQTNSIVYKERFSAISSELPYQEATISIINENEKYDIENPNSDIQKFEKGQRLIITWIYEFEDGTTETLPYQILFLKSYSVDHTTLTLVATDILNSLSDTVQLDVNMHGDGDHILTLRKQLAKGYEGYFQFKGGDYFRSNAPVWYGATGDRKQVALMYATANNKIITFSNSGNVIFARHFSPIKTVNTDGSLNISYPFGLKDHMNTEYVNYISSATFELNRVKADGKMKFPKYNNKDWTGYISSEISNSEGKFTNPALLYVNFELGVWDTMTMVFEDGTAPKKWTYDYVVFNSNVGWQVQYSGPELTNEYTDKIILDSLYSNESGTIRPQDPLYVRFKFLEMHKPHTRVHLMAIRDYYVSDYIMTSNQYEQYFPTLEEEEPLQDIKISRNAYSYEPGGDKTLLYNQNDVFMLFNTTSKIIELSSPVYDIAHTLSFNASGSQVTDNGVFTITPYPNNYTEEIKHVLLSSNAGTGQVYGNFGIYATPLSYAQSNYAVEFNKEGQSIQMTNDLVATPDYVARWYNHEMGRTKVYKIDFMGDPSLQTRDIITLENKYTDKLYVRLEYVEHTFSNGGLRGYIEGRKV